MAQDYTDKVLPQTDKNRLTDKLTELGFQSFKQPMQAEQIFFFDDQIEYNLPLKS